jgi:hypothetical protein
MAAALREALEALAAPPDVQIAQFGGAGPVPVSLMRRYGAAWWAAVAEADWPPDIRQRLDELLALVVRDREYMHESAARPLWVDAALFGPGRWAEARERALELLRLLGGDP